MMDGQHGTVKAAGGKIAAGDPDIQAPDVTPHPSDGVIGVDLQQQTPLGVCVAKLELAHTEADDLFMTLSA